MKFLLFLLGVDLSLRQSEKWPFLFEIKVKIFVGIEEKALEYFQSILACPSKWQANCVSIKNLTDIQIVRFLKVFLD